MHEQEILLETKKLKPDRLLYEAFLAKLETDIERFGQEKMALYVQQLTEMNRYVRKKCKIKEFEDGHWAPQDAEG